MTEPSRPPEDESRDDRQLSTKHGKQSDAKKEATTRHGRKPAPETSPTPGAHGREDEQRARGELRNVGGPASGELAAPEERDEDRPEPEDES